LQTIFGFPLHFSIVHFPFSIYANVRVSLASR